MKPAGRVGDIAFCPSDSHGCPGCAHPVQGPAIQGSPNVLINDLPALRVGDPGIHAACCGGNKWKAKEGASTVIVNNKKIFRLNDPTKHCGGDGTLVGGSPNVLVGDSGGERSAELPATLEFILLLNGHPVEGLDATVEPGGRSTTDQDGRILFENLKPGKVILRVGESCLFEDSLQPGDFRTVLGLIPFSQLGCCSVRPKRRV